MSNIDQKLITRKSASEQELSSKLMESEMGLIHKIYFDLSVLQDFNIGALLLHTSDEHEYNAILSNIPLYLARIEPAVCKYFPTKLTDDELRSYISNPDNAWKLYRSSPHTTLWHMLPDIFRMVKEKNRMVDGADLKCTVYLNIYPTGYNSAICQRMAAMLRNLIHPKLGFSTINKNVTDLQRATRILPDMYFVENIGEWMCDSLLPEFYDEGLYNDKFFFTKRMVSNNNVTVPVVEAFEKSRNFANIFTAMEYMDIGIPGIQYIPAVKTDPSDSIKI